MKLTIRLLLQMTGILVQTLDEICVSMRATAYAAQLTGALKLQKRVRNDLARVVDQMSDDGYGS
jgi:hypothetical protein